MTKTSDKRQISDVLIIGGGIIGLSIARELHKKRSGKITILERGRIGKEASHAAAGMLAPNAETEKLDAFYKFCDESNKLYSAFAEELFDETGIDVELNKSGTLYLALTKTDSAEIRRRFDWQKSAGLEIELLSANETRRLEPFVSPDVRESLFFPNDWQVENRKLICALENYAEINQINICENVEIKRLIIENGKVIGVEAHAEKFYGEKVILTAGAWSSLIEAKNSNLPEIKPIRGQMISFHTAKQLFERTIYSPRGYLVPRHDGRILIGATVEDVGFDKDLTQAGIATLCETAFEIAPSLASLDILEKWAGLRPLVKDGLPILGDFSSIENFFIATAHYRNGILLAPLTAKIMAEKIAENKNSEYLKIFSPQRFRKTKSFEFQI